MVHVLQPGTGVRHRLVFELRYDCGELFLDRCGRIARSLAAKKGWALHSVDPNGCRIWNEDQNLIFSYSPTKLDMSQSQSQDVPELLQPGEFAATTEEFSEVVVRTLELSSFPRIGFRLWNLFGTDSVEEASSRISRMSFFSPCQALSDLGEISFMSPSAVVARPKHMVRVAATPFEQYVHLAPSLIAAARDQPHRHDKDQRKLLIQKMKAQKAIKEYPAAGVMIDVDAYIEDAPYPEQVSARTFMEDAMSDFEVICNAILSEEKR